ncbi:hypothetical protein AB595_11300 [Massilia sp. WF1]|uniref:hypothetical protein n=1 Tax=unclassified Massilia TaxID=2609279 RepID=UPI0006497EDF|nr:MULTISPECIES: hypothetical protein [unclassified Massilia]ALK97218.1 hypothetical protein AM586_14185 [Massilia sp. WG5]KLU36400.1 hypothetical protein AB595_11300 [Massilia sp. WF1]
MIPLRYLPHSLATLALLALGATGAMAARKDTPPALADFDKLTGTRPGKCEAAPDPAYARMGEPTLRQCAWSQRLEMQYWKSIPAPEATCLPPAAIAWHRLSSRTPGGAPPWSKDWTGQARVAGSGELQQAVAVWQAADGSWSAVAWRWRPSDRPDTRAWQQAHWDPVAKAAQAVNAGNPAPASSPLLDAWLAGTNGKPRILEGDTWRWASDKTCMVLRTAGIGQGQLHLPYSRDDSRLEQRTAMQVQLARRFPAAEWLQPFTLLDPATAGTRSGAKFIAVWREGAAIQGQLWIPLRDNAGIVRARIGTDAPRQGPHADDVAAQRAALVERELKTLAQAWEARHE